MCYKPKTVPNRGACFTEYQCINYGKLYSCANDKCLGGRNAQCSSDDDCFRQICVEIYNSYFKKKTKTCVV